MLIFFDYHCQYKITLTQFINIFFILFFYIAPCQCSSSFPLLLTQRKTHDQATKNGAGRRRWYLECMTALVTGAAKGLRYFFFSDSSLLIIFSVYLFLYRHEALSYNYILLEYACSQLCHSRGIYRGWRHCSYVRWMKQKLMIVSVNGKQKDSKLVVHSAMYQNEKKERS